MAHDYVRLNQGSGPDKAAADHIDGKMYQRVKLTLGANGVNDGDLSSANPLPSGFSSDTGVIQLTTSALGAGGVFTSSTIDASVYPYIHTWCFADQQGTLVFQESVDGVTFRTSQTFDVRVSSARSVHHTPATRYCRYRFTNGVTAQGTFELQISPKQTGYHDLQMVTLQKGCGFQDTTTTSLGISATYTAPSADTSNQGQLFTVAVKADVAGTLFIEESHNNSAFEITDTYAISANVFTERQHSSKSRYVRCRYVNGAIAQTTWFLQSMCRTISVVDEIKIDQTQNTVIATQNGVTFDVQGDYSSNTSPPVASTGIWTLPGIATGSKPTYSEGNVNTLSLTLKGTLRVTADMDGSPAITRVSQSATNVTVIASNSIRGYAIIHNDSTANLYIKFGNTATTTSYTYKLRPDEHWEMKEFFHYEGQIDGIWDAAGGGAAQCTDLSS